MKKILSLLVSGILFGSTITSTYAELIETPTDETAEIITTVAVDSEDGDVTATTKTDLIGSKTFLYYYGNGCSHCAKVDAYLKGVNAYDVLDIVKKDTWDRTKPENNESMLKDAERLGIAVEQIGVPFLIITENGTETYLTGDKSIIDYFTPMLGEVPEKDGTIVLIILGLLVVVISAGIIIGGKKK
ncbi:hypothetical protein A9Q91_00545 [Candidatus Gracilibacteria bacterium 28_42_T64]|nr:hypothetical protein A9Q91_00545 [Candidatus Gracilibacteria bacterium 28_42_T64]